MKSFFAVAAIVAIAGSAQAVTLANWTFESSVPDTAGPFAAEAGVNAVISQASGFHANSSVVYSNPVGNGSAESFSSNFWTAGDYYQFTTSTAGYDTISFGWSQVASSTGPTSFAVQWSSDGVNFNTLTNYIVGTSPSWSSLAANPGAVYAPVALPAAANDLANVWVRLTSLVTPGNTGGTSRVDDVFFNGTLIPTPGSVALFGAAGFAALRRRRSA